MQIMNMLMKYSPVLITHRQHYLLQPEKCPHILVLFHFLSIRTREIPPSQKTHNTHLSPRQSASLNTLHFVLFDVCRVFVFTCLCICVPPAHLVPKAARRRSYRWSWSIMWVLGIKPATPGRAACALTNESSPQPPLIPFYSYSLLLCQELL